MRLACEDRFTTINFGQDARRCGPSQGECVRRLRGRKLDFLEKRRRRNVTVQIKRLVDCQKSVYVK